MDEFCPRLIDYIVFVGSNSPEDENGDTQVPVILNRFPPIDHSDFVLPPDVSLFCQPEGCFSVKYSSEMMHNQSMMDKAQAPFAFTITYKDSNKVRYGMCVNFFRRIRRILPLAKRPAFEDNSDRFDALKESIPGNEGSEMDRSVGIYRCAYINTLTSICFISHHQFFSKLRDLAELLYTLIQKLHDRSRSKLKFEETVWGILLGCGKTSKSALVMRSVQEVVAWILRLLSAPAPVPGKTCVYLHVLPKTMKPPLLFGLPDKCRLPLTDFPLCLPFEIMGAEKTLRIILYMLFGEKVVLQSADYRKLSFCVLALVSLLHPLQYIFPVIPLLPPCMRDAEHILLLPTPYLIGIPTAFFSVHKGFHFPRDAWLINLDTQEFVYPEVLREIPHLPEPEGSYLIEQLNAIIGSESETKPTNLAISKYIHSTRNSTTKEMAIYNPLEFISDEHSTRVAVRVAMILFFHAKNVLGGLDQHTRTLRLYPRPIAALQFGSFMKSRPNPCLFTSMLAKTPVVGNFVDRSICAKRDSYQRILEGERSPSLISDHAEWFAPFFTPIHVNVWPITGHSPLPPLLTVGEPAAELPLPPGEIMASSPLLSAGLAANLHLATGKKSTASHPGQAPTRSADVPVTPTAHSICCLLDESVSDAETDRSTTSVESTNLSDVVSDWLDSGIGEPLRKQSTIADSGLSTTTEASLSSSSSSRLRPESSCSLVMDSEFCFHLGESLPPELARHFSPPRQPVLEAANAASCEENQAADLDPDKPPLPIGDLLSQETAGLAHKSRDHRSPSSPSIAKTLRTLQRISANMFNPEAAIMTRKAVSPSIIEDVDSSFQYLDPKIAASMEQLKKRKENECYIKQIAALLKDGEVPNYFVRHRIISMMEQESSRNLMLTLLNNNFDLSHMEPESHVRDVAIGQWTQYKAMVWMLQHVTAGIEANFRPHVAVLMAAANLQGHDFSGSGGSSSDLLTSTQGIAFRASAFGLLEIAHTHYFQLVRQPADRWRFSSVESDFGERQSGGGSSLNPLNPRRSVGSSRADLASNGTSVGHDSQRAAANGEVGIAAELSSRRADVLKDEVEILPPFKSVRSQGFRYRYSQLIHTDTSSLQQKSTETSPTHPELLAPESPDQTASTSSTISMIERRAKAASGNRTYVFEDLVSASGKLSTLWSNSSFWVDAYLDSVAQERDILGMDYRPSELLERYATISALRRERLELEEDELLATLLHNAIAFMVMMSLPVDKIRRITRRLLAMSNMGLRYAQDISTLMDVLEHLHGNDIDLKPPKSRLTHHASYEVHAGSDSKGDLLFMQVCPDFLLLRDISGSVVRRWWYDQLIHVASHPHSHTIRLSIRLDQRSTLHTFYSKKCQTLYHEIQRAVALVSAEEHQGPAGVDLEGELNVLNADTQDRGTIKISSDGFIMKFDGVQTFVGIPYIKRCSTPAHDLFVIDYFDVKENRLVTCRFHTDVATSMVYMFKRLIASASLVPPNNDTDRQATIAKQSGVEPAEHEKSSSSSSVDVPADATG